MPAKRRKVLYLTALLLAVVPLLLASGTESIRQRLPGGNLLEAAYRAVVWEVSTTLSRSRIEEYVRGHSVRKLQIGAGPSRLEGWLNTDIFLAEGLAYLDATREFPLEDGSFHYVFSEHVIEHLSYEGGENMLRETYRVLAPGGKVRIATPNLLRFVALFQKSKTEQMQGYMEGKLQWHQWPARPSPECFILNLQMSEFSHKFLYDPETLKAALAAAGFRSIQEFKVGESDDPHLREVERRRNLKIKRLNDYETMVFQAVKP